MATERPRLLTTRQLAKELGPEVQALYRAKVKARRREQLRCLWLTLTRGGRHGD